MGGGGSKGPSQQTVTQSNLPEYAKPYFERLMGRTEASSNEAYTPYGGPRVAGFTPTQQAAANNINGMTRPWAADHAVNLADVASHGALGTTAYKAGAIGSSYKPGQVEMFDAPNSVKATFKPGQFDGSTADQYMSPYQQNVIDIAKREATRQHAQSQVGRDATAAQRGSFGGSRAALVKQEAQRGHEQQLDDIQMKGSQQAYENAQQQFERDRAAKYQASQQGLGADQFNAQQQMDYGKTGLSTQQFNEQARQEGGRQQLQGQTAQEQARAAAAGIQQKGYGMAGDMATQMSNMGKTQQELDLQRYNASLGIGSLEQQLNQKGLDTAYDDFVNQRDFDKQQLAFMSGILRGVPVTANTDVRTQESGGNPLSQVAGLGIAGLGAYNASKG